jgi:hypothetical protein
MSNQFLVICILQINQRYKNMGAIDLNMWAIKFWWGSCKTSSKSRSWFYKTFPSFFSSETWLYIFFCYFFGCFCMKLFLVKFFKWIYLPCPLENFHQTSSKDFFGSKSSTLPSKLIANESPLLEALNDLHVHFDLNLLIH